jgi:hypothetical protein
MPGTLAEMQLDLAIIPDNAVVLRLLALQMSSNLLVLLVYFQLDLVT